MNQIIRNWTSLANLTRTRQIIAGKMHRLWQMFLQGQRGNVLNIFSQIGKNVSGQIATLLTLVMVVILVLILVTVNIGNTSLKATALSNAADAGALQLASQLSTASRQIWKSLADEGEEGSLKSCQKGGLCGVIVAAVMAIVAVVITLITWGGASVLAVMAIGALAGAIGGLQGGLMMGLKGNALWNQVILGASIGAAIGSCGALAAGGLGGAATTTVAAGTTETVTVAAGTTATVAVEAGATATVIVEAGATVTITAATGSTVTVVAAAGSTVTITAAAGATVTVAAAAGSTVTVTAGAGSTVTVTAAAGSEVSIMSGTGSNVAVTGEAGAKVAVDAGKGSTVTAQGGMSVTTPSTLSQIGNSIVKGYQAVNNFIGNILSLPGKALNWLASKVGLGSATNWLAAPLAKELAIGEALAMGASAGSSIYKEAVQQKMKSDVMNSFSNALSSLADRDAYREGTFLSVLSQTVDDPNETPDIYDSDGDGDTTEKISYFQYWWDERIKALKEATAEAFGFIGNLWSDDIPVFKEFLQNDAIPDLNRTEIEGGDDGPIVELCRALENAPDINGNPIDVSFWEAGPTLQQWEDWLAVPCEEGGCENPPPGFDETDYTINKFKNFLDMVEAFEGQDQDTITASWNSWFDWFYDPEPTNPEEDGSYYTTFGRILYGSSDPGNEFLGLVDWQNEISSIRDVLGDCIYNYDDEGNLAGVDNSPCKANPDTLPPNIPEGFATIDADLEDEFVDVDLKIQNMMGGLDIFRNTLSNVYGDIQAVFNNVNIDEFGGLNPVIYSWSDSLGEHSITVETGPFKEPSTEETSSGGWFIGEDCIHLRNHSDDGKNTWVKVRREDPDEAQVGILGFWKAGPIERTSHAAYSYDANSVKLVN